jgi:hypothetical protein
VIAVALLGGLALGLASLTALRWTVRLYVTAGRRAAGIALHAARMALVMGALWLAALAGAAPLAAFAGGLLVARPIAFRWGPR